MLRGLRDTKKQLYCKDGLTVHLRLFIFGLLTWFTIPTFAQDAPIVFATATPKALPTAYVEPQEVILQAEDGAYLVGEFYRVDPNSPTVILLHQLYTNRTSWDILIEPLIGAHYNILAVDLRGYGESSRGINWHKAVTDVQLWFDWLRAEGGVRGDAISTMGSSMGSTLAIIGCANDELCKTPIAISPGWDYYGIVLDKALAIGLANRPTLILYAERDRWPALGMPQIEETATGLLQIEVFPANLHGIDLIKQNEDESLTMILDWLALHSGR